MAVPRPTTYNGVPVPYGTPWPELIEVVRAGPNSTRWATTYALLEVRDPACLEALGKLLNSINVDVRNAVLFTIGEHPDGRTVSAIVLRGFADPDLCVVRTACRAAGKLGLVEANDQILSLLNQTPAVQLEALAAIKTAWLPSNFFPVLQFFRKARDDRSRKEAAWALFSNATSDNWRELFDLERIVRLLENRRDPPPSRLGV